MAFIFLTLGKIYEMLMCRRRLVNQRELEKIRICFLAEGHLHHYKLWGHFWLLSGPRGGSQARRTLVKEGFRGTRALWGCAERFVRTAQGWSRWGRITGGVSIPVPGQQHPQGGSAASLGYWSQQSHNWGAAIFPFWLQVARLAEPVTCAF